MYTYMYDSRLLTKMFCPFLAKAKAKTTKTSSFLLNTSVVPTRIII